MRAVVSGNSIAAALLAGASTLFTSMAAVATDPPANPATSDVWEFKAEAYAWLPTIKATVPTGDDIEIKLDDIVDALDFTFMGGFKARKNKWSFVTDVLYLKLSADDVGKITVPVAPLKIPSKGQCWGRNEDVDCQSRRQLQSRPHRQSLVGYLGRRTVFLA